MANSKPKKTSDLSEIELHADAWERFEKFVETSVKTRHPAAPKAAMSRGKAATEKQRKKA